MAWRARVGCVLLAPCLVAARPMAQSNAPVPLSHELSRTRRALTGYVMDDITIRTAVTAWFDDRSGAEATYGHISAYAPLRGDTRSARPRLQTLLELLTNPPSKSTQQDAPTPSTDAPRKPAAPRPQGPPDPFRPT